jgi:hypothetical protein
MDDATLVLISTLQKATPAIVVAGTTSHIIISRSSTQPGNNTILTPGIFGKVCAIFVTLSNYDRLGPQD